jgi:hypothetical protein
MTKSTPTVAPNALRRLDSPGAAVLADLIATFEELQTVLRCCERLVSAVATGDSALDWHRVLLQLREHYADPTTNPREQFSIGVAQDPDGAAGGVAVTSGRQPLVDDVTVRQTGAIAFALSALVDERITAQQASVFAEVKDTPKSVLDKLARLEVAQSD